MAGREVRVNSLSPCVGITWDVGGGAGVVTVSCEGGGSVGASRGSRREPDEGNGVAARSDSSLGGAGTVSCRSLAFASQSRMISACKLASAISGESSGARGFMVRQ
jgi:hypothetical protein